MARPRQVRLEATVSPTESGALMVFTLLSATQRLTKNAFTDAQGRAVVTFNLKPRDRGGQQVFVSGVVNGMTVSDSQFCNC